MTKCIVVTMATPSDAGATSEKDPLHVLDDIERAARMIRERCVQCLMEPPLYDFRVGVLRYNWESDRHKRNLPAVPPEFQSSTLHDYTLRCEFCGERPRPTLDRLFHSNTETPPGFCCNQWQQLCQKLKEETVLSPRNCPVNNETCIKPQKSFSYDQQKSSVSKDYLIQPSKSSFLLELSDQPPEANELSAPQPNVLKFSLAGPPVETWRILHPLKPREVDQKIKDELVVLPIFDHKPVRFGLCYHQVVAGVQKLYSDGSTFLAAYPDGSAHIFYPSGLLAVIVVPSGQNGSVCIVYDDIDAPDQPMRAIFYSHGCALCNHSNGQVWLILNGSGGQRFTDAGSSVCRWNWSSRTNTPTPLHPIFLSLNKMVGVRVLGKNQVFVCFLAKGKQAKFSVGRCCAQCESKVTVTRPVKQHDEERRSIISRFHAAAEKLVDCDRALQSSRTWDS